MPLLLLHTAGFEVESFEVQWHRVALHCVASPKKVGTIFDKGIHVQIGDRLVQGRRQGTHTCEW